MYGSPPLRPPAAPAFAVLRAELPAGDAPAAFRLLPYGRFRAADGSGRPAEVPAGWLLDAPGAAALAAAANARRSARVIDFEHQTLRAEANGQPAPAAGWIGKLEARADGLYAAAVEWTAQAAAMIAAKQYRYISPVFSYDTQSGRVLAVVHAALTNDPGLDGLTDLAALAAQLFPPEEEPRMKALLQALGLAETASESEALAALAALDTRHQGELAAALKGRRDAGAPDPTQYVEIAVLTAERTQHAQTAAELAALRAAQQQAEVDAVIGAALAAGKLTPATEPHARRLAALGLADLKAFIDSAPAIVKPGETQTGGRKPDDKSVDTEDAAAIAEAALRYQRDQAAAGLTLTTAAAVAHVTQRGS